MRDLSGTATGIGDRDRKLLALLRQNARRTVSEMAAILGISRTAVKERMDRLVAAGVIKQFTIRMGAAPRQRPRSLRAFFHLQLHRPVCPQIFRFVEGWPELVGCWSISGKIDMIVLIDCAGHEEIERLRDEYRLVYSRLDAPFLPRLMGWEDGELPLLVLEDLSGAVWAATAGAGVAYYDRTAWTSVTAARRWVFIIGGSIAEKETGIHVHQGSFLSWGTNFSHNRRDIYLRQPVAAILAEDMRNLLRGREEAFIRRPADGSRQAILLSAERAAHVAVLPRTGQRVVGVLERGAAHGPLQPLQELAALVEVAGHRVELADRAQPARVVRVERGAVSAFPSSAGARGGTRLAGRACRQHWHFRGDRSLWPHSRRDRSRRERHSRHRFAQSGPWDDLRRVRNHA